MDKKQFEKIMDVWSSHEVDASPELFPSEEMYRKLTEKRKGSRKWFFGPFGWTVAATAAAVVLLFVIFLPDISRQTGIPEEPAVSFRKGEVADRMAPSAALMESVEKEKMEEAKTAGAFNQLYFQQQKLGAKSIIGVDIQAQRDEEVNVTPTDNYRLQVQLNQERYVYVFQMGTDQQLNRLFPNKAYNAEQNPLQVGPLYNFPASPNWLLVNEDSEEGTIYVVAADKPQQDWDVLYDQYSNLKKRTKQQEIAKQFVDELESMSNRQEKGIEVQKFVLKR